MELDQLKDLWKAYTDEIVHSHKVSGEEINDLLSQKSRHTIQKICRNLVLEGILIAVASIALIIGLLHYQFPYLVTGITVILAWMIIVLTLYTVAHQALRRVELHNNNVKEVLGLLTRKMEFFIKIAHYYTVILAPIFAIGGFFYGLVFRVAQDGKNLMDIGLVPWIVIIIVLTIFLFLAIKLSKWLLYKLYGVHYHQLIKYAEELE